MAAEEEAMLPRWISLHGYILFLRDKTLQIWLRDVQINIPQIQKPYVSYLVLALDFLNNEILIIE